MPAHLFSRPVPMSHLTVALEEYRIAPGAPVSLGSRDPAGTQGIGDERAARKQKHRNLKHLADLQEKLYAEGKQSLLLVLQAMDTAGKDSTIEEVAKGLNPQGCVVTSFKAPTDEEKAHDFLWRVHRHAPRAGFIAIFNRSHYEDVLVVRVHGWASDATLEARYEHINAFEALLAGSGTRVVKVMLHVSKAYQLGRLRRRLKKPDKHWKFNPADLEERERWDAYMRAYETALERCSTPQAPWYVIPAEKRWFRDLAITQLLRQTLEEMDPQYPAPLFDPADYPPDAIR